MANANPEIVSELQKLMAQSHTVAEYKGFRLASEKPAGSEKQPKKKKKKKTSK